MQERVEKWLCYWMAKPMSWAIFGIWLALKYAWIGCAWCGHKLRERWKMWRAKGNAVIHPDSPTKRANNRQAA